MTVDLFTESRRLVPVVVGLDLSLTATGFAGPEGTRVITSAGHKGDTLGQRNSRLDSLLCEIVTATVETRPDLVLIEGPSLGQQRQGGTHDRSGLWWLVVSHLFAAGLDVIEVPPATVKKYATGKGNAPKPDVRMAVFRRYGHDFRDDNEADAFVLRAIGLHLLGQPIAIVPADREAALAKLPRPALRGAA